MYRWFIGVALLAAAGIALLPERSDAQYRYRANIGGRNAGVSYGNVPYYYGNRPYGYGYGYDYYRPYGYYGPYNTRSSWWGTPGYFYSSPGYYYTRPTYTYDWYPAQYAQSGYSNTQGYQSYYPAAGTPAGNTARVEVRVPSPDAQVWFDGTPTQQRGTVRTYESPELNPGRTYTYQIRARWTEGGETRDQTRTVQVQLGQQVSVDFTRPERVGGE